ncbi:MAG: WG repeat-containing protein [Bacteroidales bacterium]|nr:WG repeat-containing protein [Bacteroidales bacterium]
MKKFLIKKTLFLIIIFITTVCSFAQGYDLVPFRSDENNKYGYKNNNGEILIEPQYDYTEPFMEGIAVVEKDDKYGMIDSKGNFVIEPEYDNGIAYHNGYFILNNYIIDKKGNRSEVKGSKKYDGKDYFDQIIWLRGSDLVLVIDKDPNYRYNHKKEQYLIHTDGTFVRQLDSDLNVDGYMGKFSMSPRYLFNQRIESSDGFNDGLCLIINSKYGIGGLLYNPDALYGYLDRTGKIVIRPQYKYAHPFSEGLASVANKRYKHGYINTNGKWAIKPQYDFAGDFKNGLAFVCSDSFVGFIDKKGNEVYNYTREKRRFGAWKDFIRGIDTTANCNIPAGAYWMGDGKAYIYYITENDRGRKVIVNEKGEVLYYISESGEKVDRDGNLIED